MFRFKKFRMSYEEVVCIYHAISDRVFYLKSLFEDWYPLCDAEMESYKIKANELQVLISLEKDFCSVLNHIKLDKKKKMV